MKKYRHLFFDLDHTLWDYDKNVRESLSELYENYQLVNLGIGSFQIFLEAFYAINFQLWKMYDSGEMDKSLLRLERFKRIFHKAGADGNAVPVTFEEDFMFRTSSKPHLLPYSKEILDYLRPNYDLHIITNGFDESQALKMKASGLTDYFHLVVTSETTGHKKPDPRIFQYAMQQAGAFHRDSLMIGDNPVSDIFGAQQVAMDQVYFDPHQNPIQMKPTYTIRHLKELEDLL
ncbi:YjjG family noncanonical pyrimidine nucleotidase [Pararhodonellum marinum]|uniref:YjjG family noncanonical pyrimidine nucleotidase n=1 Tax=Pararhodonellum marinum TaxID=2755358 RepID=UPI00188E9E07|nr:YjjG family noncanonical pyrimidine nucleotidase [Pararhodonellum marinum]